MSVLTESCPWARALSRRPLPRTPARVSVCKHVMLLARVHSLLVADRCCKISLRFTECPVDTYNPMTGAASKVVLLESFDLCSKSRALFCLFAVLNCALFCLFNCLLGRLSELPPVRCDGRARQDDAVGLRLFALDVPDDQRGRVDLYLSPMPPRRDMQRLELCARESRYVVP